MGSPSALMGDATRTPSAGQPSEMQQLLALEAVLADEAQQGMRGSVPAKSLALGQGADAKG